MNLFDTLDADGSGSLDLPELVSGIMKLRGAADKGDIVASLLSVRHMQKTLGAFESRVLAGQRTLANSHDRLEENVKTWLGAHPPNRVWKEGKDLECRSRSGSKEPGSRSESKEKKLSPISAGR